MNAGLGGPGAAAYRLVSGTHLFFVLVTRPAPAERNYPDSGRGRAANACASTTYKDGC
ncbi:MAG: hypothetical protein ACRYFV_03250 [Janthinobacterium lividum]